MPIQHTQLPAWNNPFQFGVDKTGGEAPAKGPGQFPGGPGQFPGGPGQFRGGMQPRAVADIAQHVLSRHDTNQDGSIDLSGEATGGQQARGGALLKAADADASGTVTLAEISAQLTVADTSGDGIIAPEEMRAYHASLTGTTANASGGGAAETTPVVTATETPTEAPPTEVVPAATTDVATTTAATTSVATTDNSAMLASLTALITQLQALLAQFAAGTTSTTAPATTASTEASTTTVA